METSIDLSGGGLTALPDDPRQNPALEELDLDRNELATLPEWIGERRGSKP